MPFVGRMQINFYIKAPLQPHRTSYKLHGRWALSCSLGNSKSSNGNFDLFHHWAKLTDVQSSWYSCGATPSKGGALFYFWVPRAWSLKLPFPDYMIHPSKEMDFPISSYNSVWIIPRLHFPGTCLSNQIPSSALEWKSSFDDFPINHYLFATYLKNRLLYPNTQ